MENHQTATKSVLNTFPDNFKLDPQTRALHLIEEAVELANSVSKKAGKLPTTLSKGESKNLSKTNLKKKKKI